MLATTLVHACPHGEGEHLQKNAHTNHRGRATRRDSWEAHATAFPPKHTHRCGGKHEGETNPVERWFATLRARTSRLVRRAYSFSKHAESPPDAIHFFITNYHPAIKQSTADRSPPDRVVASR